MKRIGIVPVSQGAGAGFIMAMVSTELAAMRGYGGGKKETQVDEGGIIALELGPGDLYDRLCVDRWFRIRQMVSYWNCVHGEGLVERIVNPKCGVNWFLRTPMDLPVQGINESGIGGRGMQLERGRAVKLLYSLPGDLAFVDFSSVEEENLWYLLGDMDQVVAVIDPLPSKLLEGYERICRLKLWKEPVTWVINRWTDQIDGKELKKILGLEKNQVIIPEVPRGLLYQGEYTGIGMIEHQQTRRLTASGMEELIKRLNVL